MYSHIFKRDDKKYIQKHTKWRVFHTGSNSSCRQHIRGHYTLYKERCRELGLTEHHHAVPREIAKAEEKKLLKGGQQRLDDVFQRAVPKEFSRQGILKAVAEFVVCDDQVTTGLAYTACVPTLKPHVY